MALINCPECGTEVSNKADKCPRCAFPIVVEPKGGCNSLLNIIGPSASDLNTEIH